MNHGDVPAPALGLERRRFLALLLSPALLALARPISALAGDDPAQPFPKPGTSTWADACSALGKVRTQSLATLAADLLPPGALLTGEALQRLDSAEAARMGTVLAVDARIPDWHNQQLDVLNEKAGAMWQDVPPEKRKAFLDALFAARDTALNADDTAVLDNLKEYVVRVRDDLEIAFWHFPALAQRVTELADAPK
jgi:hypothetical protein